MTAGRLAAGFKSNHSGIETDDMNVFSVPTLL